MQVQDLHDKLRGIARPLIQVGEALGIQAGQWAIIAAAMYGARAAINHIRQAVHEAMEDFQKYNAVLLRTSFLFRSMGTPIGMTRLQGFARERAATTGIAEDETLNLLGRGKQIGFSNQTLSRLVPLAQDLETSGRGSARQLLEALNNLMHQEGRGRGSMGAISGIATQFGLDPRFFTGGQQHDLQEVMRQLSVKVGGLSEIMGQTISGTFSRNQTLLQGTMARLGGLIEAALVPMIETMNRSLLGLQRTMDLATNKESGFGKVIRWLEEQTRGASPLIFPELQILLHGLRRLQDQGGTADMARKQDEANKHLAAIEGNTQNIASAIFLSVFGSASAFTRQAATFRNLQSAINFRG